MKVASEKDWIVVFGGAGRQGVLMDLAKRGVSIKAIFVPDTKSQKLSASIEELLQGGMPVLETSKKTLAMDLKPWAGCALLSIGFPYIIPCSVLDRHELRLNIHPTLLPKYRGPTSGAHIIINGEKKTGSTVHVLEKSVDSGGIIAQSSVPLDLFDTVKTMQKKVYETEPGLMLLALNKLDEGITPVPQDETQATIYPKRYPGDSEIDPKKTMIELYNAIRACDPEEYPAYFFVNGRKVGVRLWCVEE